MANQFFDEYYFEGTYREVGRQYGEAIREKMRSVYEANYERARTKDGVPDGELREQVAAYYALCEKYFPDLVEQLRGEGESSGIGDFGAMLLNVSREIGAVHAGRLMECTSYAVGGEYTTDGACYSGQNQDMANGYEENCDMVTFAVTGKPQIMFMLPVGCIGFSGMNSEGISCNRDFLFGSPWKFAVPRYFVTRLALENTTLDGVRETMERFDYPSSHHSLYADRHGNILSYELDSTMHACGNFKGMFVHTNHFLLPEMLKLEKRSKDQMFNSLTRLEFLNGALEAHKGYINPELLKKFLSSHENGEHSVCVHGYHGHSTTASMINCLNEGKMLVSKGNPCVNGYKEYCFR